LARVEFGGRVGIPCANMMKVWILGRASATREKQTKHDNTHGAPSDYIPDISICVVSDVFFH